MDEKERQEDLALLRELERQLRNLDRDILDYPLRGDDKRYRFLNQKAANYRDMIQRLKSKLYEN